MLTKNTIKYIKSLTAKKFREEFGVFIAEGPKLVSDIIQSTLKTENIYATKSWIDDNLMISGNSNTIVCVSEEELSKISQLTTANQVLAVVKIPVVPFDPELAKQTLIITLDDIRDPGNLGTIIRIADWFGYRHILCSHTTVDAYNPKCVQATMGSITRVNVYYKNIVEILSQSKEHVDIYGAFLKGQNIYNETLDNNGFLIIGNEASGISPLIEKLVSRRLFIPSGNNTGSNAESLNASAAAAIICSEFFRRSQKTTNGKL